MCEQHKNYQGRSEPKHACLNCWKMWLAVHRDEQISGQVLLNVVQAVEALMLITAEEAQEASDSAANAASSALYVANLHRGTPVGGMK